MRVRVLRVLLLLLLLLLFVHAGVCRVAECGCVKFGSVLVQVPNRWWLHRFVYSSRDSEVARAHITFLPFSTGTHVIWAGCFCVVVLRQAGQIE